VCDLSVCMCSASWSEYCYFKSIINDNNQNDSLKECLPYTRSTILTDDWPSLFTSNP